jgi:hypothetical protein
MPDSHEVVGVGWSHDFLELEHLLPRCQTSISGKFVLVVGMKLCHAVPPM